MKIKTIFYPADTPNEPGRIAYRLSNSRGDTTHINTSHYIYPYEWNHYRNTIRMPRKSSPRKSELKAIENEIKCDIMQIQDIYRDYIESGEIVRLVRVANSFYLQRRSHSFVDFIYDTIDHLTIINRHGTAQSYTSALKSFMNFRKNVNIDFADIDSNLIQRYEAYLINRGVSPNTISFYMRNLRAIYNRAVEKGLVA